MLFNEPKLLKLLFAQLVDDPSSVSVLFNEPKLLKYCRYFQSAKPRLRFSALQRAEIAEMDRFDFVLPCALSFSALQRAEIAEILSRRANTVYGVSFQCSSTSRNC